MYQVVRSLHRHKIVFLPCRFFAWLVEILARLIFGLDLSLDTFGLFSISGIVVNLKNGLKIVSGTFIVPVLFFYTIKTQILDRLHFSPSIFSY